MKNIIEKSIKQKLTDLKSEETKTMFSKISTNIKLLETVIKEQQNILKERERRCNIEEEKTLILNSKKNKVFLSFNGGKDCTAALIFLKYYYFTQENSLNPGEFSSYKLFCTKEREYKINENNNIVLIYFFRPDTFKEEVDYCYSISKRENFQMVVVFSDYKTGMYYLKKEFSLENIFMGIRKDDISFNTNKEISIDDLIQVSDGNYPKFKRAYPIFQLDYSEVWMLILQVNYPYLTLYDNGFTSIGRKSKTLKNDSIIFENNENALEYFPAYCLKDLESERAYRKLD